MGDKEINLVHRGYLALTACGERQQRGGGDTNRSRQKQGFLRYLGEITAIDE